MNQISTLFLVLLNVKIKNTEPIKNIKKIFFINNDQISPARNNVCKFETKYLAGIKYVIAWIIFGIEDISNKKPDNITAGKYANEIATWDATNWSLHLDETYKPCPKDVNKKHWSR